MRATVALITSHLSQSIPAVMLSTSHNTYIINLSSGYIRNTHYNHLPSKAAIFFTKTNVQTISGVLQLLQKTCNKIDARYCFYGQGMLFQILEQVRFKIGLRGSHFSFSTWNRKKSHLGMPYEVHKRVFRENKMRAKFASLDSFIKAQLLPEERINAKACLKFMRYDDEDITIIPLGNTQPISFMNVMHGLEQTFMLVVHVDAILALDAIMAHPSVSQLRGKSDLKLTVIHIVEKYQVLSCPQYASFIDFFPQSTLHYVFNQNVTERSIQFNDYYASSPSIQLTSILAKRYPHFFPNLKESEQKAARDRFNGLKALEELFLNRNVRCYQKSHIIDLPTHQFVQETTSFTPKKYTFASDAPLQTFETIPQSLQSFNPLVVMLGTQACCPNPTQNVSGIFIRLPTSQSILFDCGINTFQQMRDHFGLSFQQVLLSLKVLFITHIHSDHYDGVASLLNARAKLTSNSDLILILPHNTLQWYATNEKTVLKHTKCRVLFTQSLQSVPPDKAYSPLIMKYMGEQKDNICQLQSFTCHNRLTRFEPIRVDHCTQSYGMVLQHESGVKISYSGDTLPCPDFLKAAHQSTLLIHEATYGDGWVEEARRDKHTMLSEAVKIGRDSGSWRTALTHFHPKKQPTGTIQPSHELKLYHDKQTIYCIDHMQFTLKQAAQLPAVSQDIYRALQ